MTVERETLSVPEAAKVLGISRGLAYEMARIGRLPTIRFGRRLVVPRRALERLMDESKATSNSWQEKTTLITGERGHPPT